MVSSALMNNLDKINADWNKMSTVLDIYNDPTSLLAVRENYFGSKETFGSEDLTTFTKLASDRHFFTGTHDTALDHINGINKPPPLFLYYFNYTGRKDKTEIGIGHLVRTPLFPFLPVDISLLIEMLRLWFMELIGFKIKNFG